MSFYILAGVIVSAVAAALYLYWNGKRHGRTLHEVSDLREAVDATRKANDVEDDVGNISDSVARDRLSEWRRD